METRTAPTWTPPPAGRRARRRRHARSWRFLLIGATVALGVAACGGLSGVADGTDATPGGAAMQLDGDWELAAGTGPEGPVAVLDRAPVTLTIDGPDWGGTSACNSYGGSVQMDGGRLTTDGFAVTEMACVDDEIMETERRYLAALIDVTDATVEDDVLVLTGSDSQLIFHRRPAVADRDLVGTVWLLESIVSEGGANGAVSSVTGDATLELDPDGSLAGSTGCNRIMAHFEREDDLLRIDALASTRMACDEGLMQQEAAVLAVLESDPISVVDGELLVLRTSDGRELHYRADR